MVASRKRRTEEHRLLIASLRIRKDFVKACFKISPSASNVFWAGGGMATFPVSERIARRRCKTFQARNRLCFDALEFCMLLIPISRLRSAARIETWKEVGTNHCNDCCSEERNTDEPRYEKAVAQKFFGKNDDG